jgi:hypothetical protein
MPVNLYDLVKALAASVGEDNRASVLINSEGRVFLRLGFNDGNPMTIYELAEWVKERT